MIKANVPTLAACGRVLKRAAALLSRECDEIEDVLERISTTGAQDSEMLNRLQPLALKMQESYDSAQEVWTATEPIVIE